MIRRAIFALGALLSLGAATQSGSAPSAADPAAAARIRAHVEFLADDLLEGRDTGSRGYDIAAAYVASQFRALGLQPGGENGGWFQHVKFRTATLAEPAPVVELIGSGGRRRLAVGPEIVVRASSQEKHQDVTAPLVFVGYGLSEPALKMDDYAGLDVRGKIVVALHGTPSGLPTEIEAHVRTTKYEAAAKHGAVGLIQVPTRASAGSRDWRSLSGSTNQSSIDWVDPSGRVGAAAGLRIKMIASESTAAALFAGARHSLARVQAEADTAGRRPQGFALKPQIHVKRTSDWHEFSSAEVIGLLPGTDPQLKDEYVVLMGHLDHLGIKKNAKAGEDAIRNGALDNAAGVATMLEAAREFVESGKRPRRSVLFIANTAEEKNLLGADYFATHPTVPIQQIVSVVDLDMPLLLYDFTDIVAFGADHSTVAQTVAQAAKSMGVSLSVDPMPEQSIFTRSDHYQFVKHGVPAILLFTGYANGGKQHWDKWLPNTYHSPQDDLSQAINWNAGARYAQLNYRISRALADADRRPLWYEGDYFGDTFAPGQPRAKR